MTVSAYSKAPGADCASPMVAPAQKQSSDRVRRPSSFVEQERPERFEDDRKGPFEDHPFSPSLSFLEKENDPFSFFPFPLFPFEDCRSL